MYYVCWWHITFTDASTWQTELNRNLGLVAGWLKENHLTLNVKKTIMMFGTGQKFQTISLIYNNNIIEIVDKFKYLGVILDP